MPTPDPQLLTTFSAIVGAGSISAAAVRLGCGKSVVSRQLTRLEADLGARLLQRTTRRLTLTEVGKVVLQQAQQIDRALDNVAQISGQFQQEVRGPLRVSCPRPLGQRHLVPLLAAFTRQYPLVEVTLQVDDRLSDLVAEQIDVAIRVAHLEDSTLVARRLADNPRVLVASPTYLERAGRPDTPEALAAHEGLLWTRDGRVHDEWSFTASTTGPDTGTTRVRMQGRLRVNDGLSLVAFACAGAGVAVIDRLLVDDELARGTLVELLPGWRLPAGPPLYAVYPARQWLALNTATFVEFLLSRCFTGRA